MRIAAALLFLTLCVGCANVPRVTEPGSGWTFLGEREFGDKDRSRKVAVDKLAGEFTDIQLRIKKVGVRLKTLKVTFADGETWEPITRFVVPAGGWTRDISIPDAPRAIRSILVRGRAIGFNTRARVRVYARPKKRAAKETR